MAKQVITPCMYRRWDKEPLVYNGTPFRVFSYLRSSGKRASGFVVRIGKSALERKYPDVRSADINYAFPSLSQAYDAGKQHAVALIKEGRQ